MISLQEVTKFNPELRLMMQNHYSKPKSFVARSICYLVKYGWITYGAIVAGSALRHIIGRDDVIPLEIDLQEIVCNTFYHINRHDGKYPERNFTISVLAEFRKRSAIDWQERYGDTVKAFESLVELPRTGEIYSRDGWREVGMTKGYTCKREGGEGTDSWSGKRVWNTVDLRPKRVFCRLA
jgi:hypothetical protein